MHILLIHQVFVSPQEPGGTRHYELAQHTLERGHQFTIVASALSYLTGKPATEREGFVTEQQINGLRVLRAYTYPALHRSFVWRVVCFLSFMVSSVWAGLRAGPIDLVMGTTPPIFQSVSAWLIALLRRRPFLLEVRDLWPAFAIDMGVLRNPFLIWASRGLEAFLYARATHILVNSPAYREYLLQKGIAPDKVTLIPNGVEVEQFDPHATGDHIRQQWRLNGHFVVTYAGALGLANDIPTILQAANHLQDHPDIHFLLVGDGKERADLERQAAQLQLRNVTFTGSMPKSQMPDVLAASDACLATLQNIPMFKTTYPNKVFDYMAAGRPTILAIDGVIRQVIEAANGGCFVQPGNAQQLAQAILSMSHDRDQTRTMGISARSYVQQHFNRRDQATKFIELLERLAKR